MKFVRVVSVLASTLLLGACACLSGNHQDSSQLQHQWALVAVDGVAVNAEIKSELTFGEALKVSGRAGCNRFFGPASVSDGVLTADKLGVTMMACSPAVQQVETAVLATLKQASVKVSGQQLELKGAAHTLTYRQVD